MAPAGRGRRAASGDMRSCTAVLAALALTGMWGRGVEGLLPSIGPEIFKEGQKLPLYVNELTSTRTQSPMDYYQ